MEGNHLVEVGELESKEREERNEEQVTKADEREHYGHVNRSHMMEDLSES